MLIKHHNKALILIGVIAVFIATFAYNKKVGADLTTNLNRCSANVGSIGITLAECTSLAHLYNETSGDNWTNHTNWFVSTNLSTWGPLNAITIDGGHVVRLTLNTNNLSGAIVQGLDNLTWLTGLQLAVNDITSIDLSNNSALEVMSLSTNDLTSIDVSANTQLREIFISSNQLSSINV